MERRLAPLLALPLALPLALASCAREPAPKKLVFAGIAKLLNNPVFEVARQGAMAKAAELGVEVRWNAPREADAIKQSEMVNAAAEQRVDGIFLSVNDATVLRQAIDRATAAGIPVVCFDSDSPESKRITCFSVDDARTGAAGADLLVEKMGTKGKVGLLHGTPGAPNLERRLDGFRRRIKEIAPEVELLPPVYCNDNTQQAIEAVKSVLQGHADLTGFYMSGGWPLFSAPPGPFLGLEPGKIAVVAFDALPEQLDYVRRGFVYALTGQRLREWGSESVRILFEWHAGKRDFPPFIDSGYDVVKKENVEAFARRSLR